MPEPWPGDMITIERIDRVPDRCGLPGLGGLAVTGAGSPSAGRLPATAAARWASWTASGGNGRDRPAVVRDHPGAWP
jgi:hypothetical protein